MLSDRLLAPSREAVRRLGTGRPALRATAYVPVQERPRFADLAACRDALERVSQLVAARMSELGVDPQRAGEIVRRIRGASFSPLEHAHASHGYAVLAGPSQVHVFTLGRRPRAATFVGRTYRIRALLQAARLESSYRVLALSANRVTLYEGDRGGLQRIEPRGVPTSMGEAVRAAGGPMDGSASAGGAASPRAAGGEDPPPEIERDRLHRAVQAALRRRWSRRRDPLILAADRTHQDPFHRRAQVPGLLAEGIDGSPDRLSAGELHARAWPLVQAELERQEVRDVESARELVASGRGLDRLRAIAASASAERVARLWVDADREAAHHVLADSGKLVRAFGDEDAIDEIAALVLAHGGDVRVCTDVSMLAESGMLAQLHD
jgi:hypothetical protein